MRLNCRRPREMFFPKLCRKLRLLGFKREWTQHGCYKVVCYSATYPNGRKLFVELWADGGHRVSHVLNGHGNGAPPTDFKTLAEMCAAIERELTRTDHSPLITRPEVLMPCE